MRQMFKNTLLELAAKDKDIILLVGDMGFGIVEDFKKKYPKRFWNCGCREQAMVGIAAGMALSGLKPYVYTVTSFLLERAFEQIKIDVDAMQTNVKLIGYDSYEGQGVTHKALNSKKLCSMFKNVICYFPKDSAETRKALIDSHKDNRPAFINLTKDI